MMSREATKAFAVFNEPEVTLKRLSTFPPDALTLEDRLMLWAQFEMVRLKLTDAIKRELRDNCTAKQKPGQRFRSTRNRGFCLAS